MAENKLAAIIAEKNKTNKVELNPNMKEEKDEEGGMATAKRTVY